MSAKTKQSQFVIVRASGPGVLYWTGDPRQWSYHRAKAVVFNDLDNANHVAERFGGRVDPIHTDYSFRRPCWTA